MPRLSTADYLKIYSCLRWLWINHRSGFGLITTKDQQHLHDFFRLSEVLSDHELLAHRKAVTAERRSLPHQAGRALKHFANPLPLRRTPIGSKRMVVYPIARPKPDLPRIARALLRLDAQVMAELVALAKAAPKASW